MENVMISRKLAAGTALIAAVGGLALAVQAQASADNVAFPENYAKGIKWLVVDKADAKQVNDLYATPEAIEAARKDQPMPNGTVFTVVQYSAQLDAQGNPVKGADGRFVKTKYAASMRWKSAPAGVASTRTHSAMANGSIVLLRPTRSPTRMQNLPHASSATSRLRARTLSMLMTSSRKPAR